MLVVRIEPRGIVHLVALLTGNRCEAIARIIIRAMLYLSKIQRITTLRDNIDLTIFRPPVARHNLMAALLQGVCRSRFASMATCGRRISLLRGVCLVC